MLPRNMRRAENTEGLSRESFNSSPKSDDRGDVQGQRHPRRYLHHVGLALKRRSCSTASGQRAYTCNLDAIYTLEFIAHHVPSQDGAKTISRGDHVDNFQGRRSTTAESRLDRIARTVAGQRSPPPANYKVLQKIMAQRSL